MLACTAHAVCEVQGYDPNAPFDRRDQDELDRFAQFVVVAACEAAYGAGLPDGSLDAVSMRVTTGCALGGKETEDAGFWRLYAEQKSRLSPFSVPRVMGGAGGALEAVITVLAIARGCIPPNVGTTKVAPDCDLGIPLSAEARSIDVALSNSFAFGGLNAVLAFQRC